MNSNLLPVNLHDVKHFACQGCLLMTCVFCKLQKTSDEFSNSQLAHKSRSGQIKCLACSNPPCIFRPKCQTCTTCRNPSCRKVQNCKKEVVKLKIEPDTMEEVVNYTCERCLYLRCTTIESDGTRCGRLRRLNKHNDAKKNKVAYQCGECATLIFSQKNRFFPKKDGIWTATFLRKHHYLSATIKLYMNISIWNLYKQVSTNIYSAKIYHCI